MSAIASFGLHATAIAGAVTIIRPSVLRLEPVSRPYVVELQLAGERPELAPIVEPAPIPEIVPQVELEEVITEEAPLIAAELDVSLPEPTPESPGRLAPLSDHTDAWSRVDGEWHASSRSAPALAGAIGVGGGSAYGAVGGVAGGTGNAVAASTASPTSGTGTAPAVAQTAAELIDSPRPTYPVLSLRRGEQGTAVVRIQIAVDGSVAAVELVESSGFTRLDDAALAGVRAWRFRPATRNGVPIASLFLHRLMFRIAAG